MRPTIVPLLAIVLTLSAGSTATGAETAAPAFRDTPARKEARIAWWQEARFGMFIHWGIYSAAGGFWNGARVDNMGEWIMATGKISMADYQAFAKGFQPTEFRAEEWVRIARQAGMRYLVMTAKHHDGFAMFATQHSPCNVVDGTAWAKDPIKDLAAACDAQGLPLGFYYSQALDWNNGGALSRPAWDPLQTQDLAPYVDRVVVPQLRELLTNYGNAPRIMWWDWGSRLPGKDLNDRIHAEVRALKPDIILNNRLSGYGDFAVNEGSTPFHGSPDQPWETCMTFNDSWGYRKDDARWKSTTELLRTLCDTISKGGNFMLNVGPTGTGAFPPECVERLQEIGAWMRIHGDAIYGSSAGPFDQPFTWGRASRKGDTVYLFVFNWPKDGHLHVPLGGTVAEAQVLGDPLAAITTATSADGLDLTLPTTAPDPRVSTIALRFTGEPQALVHHIAPGADGTLVLAAGETRVEGNSLLLSLEEPQFLHHWRTASDVLSWRVDIPRAGTYQVDMDYACDGRNAGSTFTLSVGATTLQGAVIGGRNRDDFRRVPIGTVTLPPLAKGLVSMRITAAASSDILRLRRLILTPIAPKP